MKSPRSRVKGGGLVGPEALVIWSNLRPSYLPGCACGISWASSTGFALLVWPSMAWFGQFAHLPASLAFSLLFGIARSGLSGVQDVGSGDVRRPVGWGIHFLRCPVVAGADRYVWRVAYWRRFGWGV